MTKHDNKEELFSDNELESVLGPKQDGANKDDIFDQGELEDMGMETMPSKLSNTPEEKTDLEYTPEERKAYNKYDRNYRLKKKGKTTDELTPQEQLDLKSYGKKRSAKAKLDPEIKKRINERDKARMARRRLDPKIRKRINAQAKAIRDRAKEMKQAFGNAAFEPLPEPLKKAAVWDIPLEPLTDQGMDYDMNLFIVPQPAKAAKDSPKRERSSSPDDRKPAAKPSKSRKKPPPKRPSIG